MISEYSFLLAKCPKTGRAGLFFVQYPNVFRNSHIGVPAKCIYVSGINLNHHVQRTYHGIKYTSLKDAKIKGKLDIVRDPIVYSLTRRYLPSCLHKNEGRNIFAAGLTSVKPEHVNRIWNPFNRAKDLMQRDSFILEVISHLSEVFNTGITDIGLTGSTLFANRMSTKDLDFVIRLPIKDVSKALAALYVLRSRSPRINAYGIDWPLRFVYSGKAIIDLFFAYVSGENSPIGDTSTWIQGKRTDFDVVVTEDTHGVYAPTCLRTNGTAQLMIILGTACRGMFRIGDRISGCAKLAYGVYDQSACKALLVKDPWKEIRCLAKS